MGHPDVTPAQEQQALALLRKGCGIPAGRDYLHLALRLQAERTAARAAWQLRAPTVVDVGSRPEACIALAFIAVICTVGLWLAACFT